MLISRVVPFFSHIRNIGFRIKRAPKGSVRPENGFQRMPNGCRTDRKYAKNTCPLISVPKSRLEGGEDHRGRFQERVNRTRTAFVTDKERLTNGQNGQETFN